MTATSPTRIAQSQGIWRAGLYAAIIATIINLIIFVSGTFAVPTGLAVTGIPGAAGATPVPWFMVIVMTVIPILLGTLAYWILHRFVPRQANLIFVIGVALVAIGSVGGPATSSINQPTAILLSAMHLVAGGVLLWTMTRKRTA